MNADTNQHVRISCDLVTDLPFEFCDRITSSAVRARVAPLPMDVVYDQIRHYTNTLIALFPSNLVSMTRDNVHVTHCCLVFSSPYMDGRPVNDPSPGLRVYRMYGTPGILPLNAALPFSDAYPWLVFRGRYIWDIRFLLYEHTSCVPMDRLWGVSLKTLCRVSKGVI